MKETTPNATLPEALVGRYRDWRLTNSLDLIGNEGNPVPPSMDTEIKASGTGSLKFTIPTHSDANDSGFFQTNFTPDNSVQFGEGDTFFVQWRQRFSKDMLFDEAGKRRSYAGSGGFKFIIINAGDHPDLQWPVSSCSAQEIVFLSDRYGAMMGYHSCGWYEGFGKYHGLHDVSGQSYADRQPGGNNHCWNLDPATGVRLTDAWPDCVMLWPDEWMTFQVQVSVGKWTDNSQDPRRSSNVRLWVAREGERSRLVIELDINLRRPEKPFMKYGKVWLLPYPTNKDPAEDHPEAYTWYDELIVSRTRIPDPS